MPYDVYVRFEKEVRRMAYDKSKDKYADYTYEVVHKYTDYFRGLFRTPEMHKAAVYQWDPETGVNMNPDEEYIDPARINKNLQSAIFADRLADFFRYSVRFSMNHPGTKFWLCNGRDAEKRSFQYQHDRAEWLRNHRYEYFLPDWIVKGDAGFPPVIVGVCKNGIWRIQEKYCGIVELVFPGGMPKNFQRVA